MTVSNVMKEVRDLLDATITKVIESADAAKAALAPREVLAEKVEAVATPVKDQAPVAPPTSTPEAVKEITAEVAAAPKTVEPVKTEAEPPKAEACYAAPAVAVLAQACFGPKRRPPVAVACFAPQAVAVAVVAPPVEKSQFFTISSVGVGDLPIGAWKVTKVEAGLEGSDWASLPYPAQLKTDIKELEALMLKSDLTEEDKTRKAELEAKYEIKVS